MSYRVVVSLVIAFMGISVWASAERKDLLCKVEHLEFLLPENAVNIWTLDPQTGKPLTPNERPKLYLDNTASVELLQMIRTAQLNDLKVHFTWETKDSKNRGNALNHAFIYRK